MFRLNRLTDYAVVVLAQMSQYPAEMRTTPQIAKATGIPSPTVAKLMNLLAHGGLVASSRGANGGYRLARPAEAISVAAIIEALDGPIALTDCVDGQVGHCEVEGLCPLRGNWDRVNQAIRGALLQVSLAEMVAGFLPPSGGAVPSGHPLPSAS